jgi:hypothetical protein
MGGFPSVSSTQQECITGWDGLYFISPSLRSAIVLAHDTNLFKFSELDWGCSSVVEHLPSMSKTLGSTPAPQTEIELMNKLIELINKSMNK